MVSVQQTEDDLDRSNFCVRVGWLCMMGRSNRVY